MRLNKSEPSVSGRVMGQLGFFDLNNRHDGLDRKGVPLALLASLTPWETFRPKLKRALLKAGLRTRPGERRRAPRCGSLSFTAMPH
jgi:hypothetical protein